METKTDEVAIMGEFEPETAVETKKLNTLRPTHWIINRVDGTKQCESCGAVMRGWAFREPFDYCPKCGKRAEKAQ